MQNKQELLQSIKELASQNALSKEELLGAFNEGAHHEDLDISKKMSIANILYCIGAAIVFIGIVIFIGQNWVHLSPLTRVLSTFGSAVAAYLAATFFGFNKKTENVGLAFHLISALVMPIGLYVVFHEAGFNMNTSGMVALISGLSFAIYIVSFALLKKNIFLLFSIIFGTWFFFGLTTFMAISDQYNFNSNFDKYRVLVAAISYMLFGYYFSRTERKPLTGFLYGFGVLGFLGSTLALGGWFPRQNTFWQLIYPGLVFAVLFLSVQLKSTSFLTFGTIFLMAYISSITAQYFSDSIGWPLSLMIIGVLLIASGYMFVYLKNKYIPKQS